ncbi:hypothetical protein TNCV_3332491 [Trichonephila clavipes]|nr:hypothetical protein TNCV_3332491 [Trichonephila clavipes]
MSTHPLIKANQLQDRKTTAENFCLKSQQTKTASTGHLLHKTKGGGILPYTASIGGAVSHSEANHHLWVKWQNHHVAHSVPYQRIKSSRSRCKSVLPKNGFPHR